MTSAIQNEQNNPALIVFVYGTLRQGQSNHRFLINSKFMGFHTTEAHFQMLNLGEYPAVVKGKSTIEGELYQVDQLTLNALDLLEGYPNLYTRIRIQTKHGSAWMYFMEHTSEVVPVIESGDWLKFNN